jgi:glycosyltransferase involved in cell wall biosynthesis
MISVIIPTFNRAEALIKTLKSIECQNPSGVNFVVIIVDVGSKDDTTRQVEDFKKDAKINVSYYYQDNGGPASARNLGVEKAKGEVVLFCGDDSIFDKDLMRQHYIYHKNNSDTAILGTVLWDEAINPSDFMHFLAPQGPMFHYHTIKDIFDAKFNHFYTINISLGKKWFEDVKFDTKFKLAAFEDIEVGLALEKKGLKIVYNKDAKIYHSHYYIPELFYERMVKVGKSIAIFRNKYKDNWVDLFRIDFVYAPFMLFPFGLRLFNIVSDNMRKSEIIKKVSLKLHWLSNIAYFYSKGILNGLEERIYY